MLIDQHPPRANRSAFTGSGIEIINRRSDYPEPKKRIGTRVLTCMKHAFTYVYTRSNTGFIIGRVFCTRVSAFSVLKTKSVQFSCVTTRYIDPVFGYAWTREWTQELIDQHPPRANRSAFNGSGIESINRRSDYQSGFNTVWMISIIFEWVDQH
jgi:hypothetical protein